MPDLSILNTLIAMVIVILVLSLIVQSLQTLIKKFFKIKSRTIRSSLLDLFETITHTPDDEKPSAPTGDESKASTTTDDKPKASPKELVDEVIKRLKEMGRETLFGRPMLDSLAKSDLLKVLTRIEAKNLLPEAVDKFKAVLATIGTLKEEFGNVKDTLLEGDASAKFAALKATVMPLVNDIEALATGGQIKEKVLLGDIYNLRQVKTTEVLDILGQVQQKVGQDLDAARKANDAAQKALAEARAANDAAQIASAETRANDAKAAFDGVTGVSDGLKEIAKQITNLGQAFDEAFAPVRVRVEQAEVWYDTVMQGFDERYTRHMRTVALVISIIVVMVLNANFFSIYRAIASDPVKAKDLAEHSQVYIDLAKEEAKREAAEAAKRKAAEDAKRGVAPEATPTPAPPASPAPSASPTPVSSEDAVKEIKEQGKKLSELVGTFQSFGIEPLTPAQIANTFKGEYSAGTLFETFAGWLIMVILLSAGAPFWQDTLESLFGLKNLLRQKSDTKNVEDDKGGQPKP